MSTYLHQEKDEAIPNLKLKTEFDERHIYLRPRDVNDLFERDSRRDMI